MKKTGAQLTVWQRIFLILRWAGFLCSLAFVFIMLAIIGIYGLHRETIPEVVKPSDYRPPLKSKVFAINGELIAEFGIHERILVKKADLFPLLKQAFIAAEDKNFYRHHGVDFSGIINAIAQSITQKRSSLRGASTLSQQLSKSLLVKKEGYKEGTARTIARKVKEAILARRLEMHLSKEDILWMYLNEVYLGNGIYGVGAAAQSYFHKDLLELSLGEIALLAGLPQAPSRFSPQINLKAALMRQAYVLNRMQEEDFITNEQREEALAKNSSLTIVERENNFRKMAPYFSETVRRMIVQEYGEDLVYEGGLSIYTTLDLDQERAMQSALKTSLIEIDKRQGYAGPVFRPKNAREKAYAKKLIEEVNQDGSFDLKQGYRLAMVKEIDEQNRIIIGFGKATGVIPQENTRWVRARDPKVHYQQSLSNNLSEFIKKGDVVLVRDLNSKDFPLPVLEKPLFSLEQEPSVEGAMFSMEPSTGYVTALNGGYSYDRSEFNRVFQACRQPGSLFKPIVYSAAIALKNYTPATLVTDAPLTFHDLQTEATWRPKNLGGGYKGEVTVREAVMRSMNIPTINVMADVGTRNVLNFAKHLGITTKLKTELGTAIGSSCVTPFELGQVYAVIANMGVAQKPILIKEIVDRDQHRLKLEASPSDPWLLRTDRVFLSLNETFAKKTRLMEEEVAYTTHYLLTNVANHGTAAKTRLLNRSIAGKTGTTNDSFDTWFAGYTKHLLSLVWVGFDSMEIPLGAYEQGARTALPIFSRFMESAHKGLPDEDWPLPSSMCLARIDAKTGLRTEDDHPLSFVAPFRCGQEPPLLSSRPNQTLEEFIQTMEN